MQKRKNIIYLVLIISFFAFFSCNIENNKNSNSNEVKETNTKEEINIDTITTKAFKTDDGGWGYDILINGKTFIHQTVIPTVNGRFTFESKEDAKITAAFVTEILMQNNGLPTVSLEELEKLNVLSQEVLDFQEKYKKK